MERQDGVEAKISEVEIVKPGQMNPNKSICTTGYHKMFFFFWWTDSLIYVEHHVGGYVTLSDKVWALHDGYADVCFVGEMVSHSTVFSPWSLVIFYIFLVVNKSLEKTKTFNVQAAQTFKKKKQVTNTYFYKTPGHCCFTLQLLKQEKIVHLSGTIFSSGLIHIWLL